MSMLFVYGSCTQLGCNCASYEETVDCLHQCLCRHMKNYHAKYVVSGGVLIPIPVSVQPIVTTSSSLFNIPAQQPQLPLSLSLGAQDYDLLDFRQSYQTSFFDNILETNHTENIINSPLSKEEMVDHFGDIEDKSRDAAETLFNFIKVIESCGHTFLTSSDLNSFYLKHPGTKDKVKEAGGLKSLIFKYHWNFIFIIDQVNKKEYVTTKTAQFQDGKIDYEEIITENYDMYCLANGLLENFIKSYGEMDGTIIRADRDILLFYRTHPEMKDFFRKFGGLVSFCFSRKGCFFPFQDFRTKFLFVRLVRSNFEIENGTKSVNSDHQSADVDLINDVYSTKLDIKTFTTEQILRAERLAKEIENNGIGNIRNIIPAPEDLDVCSNENILRISHKVIKFIRDSESGNKMRFDRELGQIYEIYPEIKTVIKDIGGISAFCSLFPSVFEIEINDGIKYLSIIDSDKNDDYCDESEKWKTQKGQKTNKKECQKIAESLYLFISQKEGKKLREKDLHKFYTINTYAKKAIDEVGGISNFCDIYRNLFRKPVVDLHSGGMLLLIRNK